MILVLRTDKPEAELGLYDGQDKAAFKTWQAHRALAETLHTTIDNLLHTSGHSLQDITGIVVYQGPGSFTGLRIGLSVANALAYALDVPVCAATGSSWITNGITRLTNGENDKIAIPEYGAPVHITPQKK